MQKMVLSQQAKDTARYLVDAWDKKIIESHFTLIDVTAGSGANTIETASGLGVLNDEFIPPPIADLMELKYAGLIDVDTIEGRGRKWEIQLSQSLRDMVGTNFGERAESTDKKESPRLFISYSRKDIVLRRLLQDKLAESYLHIWSDERFLGSERWWTDILSEIDTCDIFILLISPDTIESLFCRAEFSEALRLQKQIVPLIIRETPSIPVVINDYQHVDLLRLTSSDQIYERIIQALERASSQIPSSPSSPLWKHKSPLPKVRNRLSVSAKFDPKDDEIELNTGILLILGDRVTITAVGLITFDGGKSFSDPRGLIRHENGSVQPFPEDRAYRVKDAPEYATNGYGLVGSLIGWIGSGNYAGGSARFIGDSRSFTVGEGEQDFLYLAVNDARGAYGDNSGEFEVHITVDRGVSGIPQQGARLS